MYILKTENSFLLSKYVLLCLTFIYSSIFNYNEKNKKINIHCCQDVLQDRQQNKCYSKILDSIFQDEKFILKGIPNSEDVSLFEFNNNKRINSLISFQIETSKVSYHLENPFFLSLNGTVVSKTKITELPYDDTTSINVLEFDNIQLKPGNHKFNIYALNSSRETENIAVKTITIKSPCPMWQLGDKALNIPRDYDMGVNAPNPFKESTTIPFQLPEEQIVLIIIHDKNHTPIDTVVNAKYEAGFHEVTWNSSQCTVPLENGSYSYSIQAGDFKYLKKMFRLWDSQ